MSSTVRCAPGCAASHSRPSTLITNPVAPVTSRCMLKREIQDQALQGARADREIRQLHAFVGIVAAMIVAYEYHAARDADLRERGRVVACTARNFERPLELAHERSAQAWIHLGRRRVAGIAELEAHAVLLTETLCRRARLLGHGIHGVARYAADVEHEARLARHFAGCVHRGIGVELARRE